MSVTRVGVIRGGVWVGGAGWVRGGYVLSRGLQVLRLQEIYPNIIQV